MKKMTKRFLSAVLVSAMALTMVPASAFADVPETAPQPLTEDTIDDSAMQENEFYFATKEATIQENAETASLLKIERGGKAESAASVKVRFIDITSKIGKDYKLSLYQEGNGKSAEISGGQSVFEKMQESSDSMQEYNSSDEAVQSVKDPSAGDGTDTESDAAGTSDSESAAAGTEESGAATAASGTSAAGSPSESSLEITDNMTPIEAKEAYTGIVSDRVSSDGETASASSLSNAIKQSADGLSEMMNAFTNAETTIEFAAGEKSKYLKIQPVDNSDGDGSRIAQFSLAAIDGTINAEHGSFKLNIQDNEEQEQAVVSLSADSYTSGDGFLTVEINREGALNQTVDVSLTTQNETAESGIDYSEVSASVTFPFGTTKRTVNIPVSSQNLDAAKTFDVILSNPVGCTIGDHSQAVCTIDPASFSASAADSDGGNETILGAADGEDSSADPVLGASDGRIIGDNPIDLKECQGQAYGRASSYYNSSNQKFEIVAPARYRETVYRPCVSYYFGGDGAYDGFQITWSVGGGSTFGNSATIKVFADNKEIKSYGSASWKMRSEIIRNDSPIKYLRIDVQNNDDGLGDLNVEIEKIVPIKKEFSFTLQQPQPLQFRLPDGSMAANTSTRKFSAAGILEANQTYLDKSDTSGTGTAIRHLNETVTVCMKNPGAYSYIRYLTLTDGHNITKQITEEQDEGTTSVSFVLTKSFLYDYTQKLGMKPLIIIPVMGYRKAVITTDNADVRTTLQPAGSLEKTKGISMGDYYLYNQDAGKYLTRDTVSGNAVGEKASGTASQLWTMSRNDDNQWTITSVLDGKKLDLPLGSSAGLFDFTKDGDSYIISDSNDSPFKLAIVRQEDGSYAAKKQTNRASQKWVLIPAVRNGRYRLRNARSGYYLTAEQAGSSSPAIMSVPAGDSSEVLYIENGSDSICTISNGNGLSLEVSANKEIMFSDSKEGNLQRFRLLPGTEPGEFRICVNDSENILHPVSSGTAGSGFDLQLPTDDIGELWKMDGTEDAQEYECHMGDSYIFSASVKSDYKSSCTMNSIAKIAYEKTTEVSEEQVSLDSSGEISVTAENSRMLLRPVIGQASNSVKLLIRKNDIRFFRSGEGSLKNGAQSYTDKATGIEYWAYTVTPEEIIDDYIWVLEVYTIDGQMTCWTEKGSDKSFSQNRFFYQPDSNKKEQVIYLTSKQSFNKFSIAGKTVMPNSAVSGTGMNDTVSGLGGVTVEAGSAKGISDENGIYDTKAFAGIIGDYIRCRYSISGHTAYCDYKIFYGELKKPTPLNHEEYRYKDGVDAVSFNMNRKGVNTVSSIRAVRINGQTQNEKYFERNVSINKNYTFKLEAEIYNPGHTNQTIKAVDFYSYNADSEKIHAKIGKGTNLKISSPFSYWTCDFSPSASSSSYDAGEKICVILTVYDFNAQKEIRIGPFFNDLTLTLSEDNKPLEQHMQYTNDFFSSLPIIGHLNTALSFKGIQVGIEDLENDLLLDLFLSSAQMRKRSTMASRWTQGRHLTPSCMSSSINWILMEMINFRFLSGISASP